MSQGMGKARQKYRENKMESHKVDYNNNKMTHMKVKVKMKTTLGIKTKTKTKYITKTSSNRPMKRMVMKMRILKVSIIE